MPFFITVAGAIRQCFPDFATARSIVLELRDQGQKPRLYYSTSFEHLGCEIDDHSALIQDYTDMGWCDFAKLLSQVDSSWSVTDDDLSNDRDRLRPRQNHPQGTPGQHTSSQGHTGPHGPQ